MSTRPSEADREWFRCRALAYRCGALNDPQEERRFAELLRTDEECRRMYEPFLAPRDDGSDGHVPPSILGGWARARLEVKGLERALLTSHLARCESCREELALLGYDPAREIEALTAGKHGAEGAQEMTVAAAPESATARSEHAARVSQPAPAMRWSPRERMVFAWAMAATVALVISAVMHLRGGSPGEQLRSGFAPALRIAVTRDAAEGNVFAIPAGTRTVVLGLPSFPAEAESGPSRVQLIGPGGDVLVDLPWEPNSRVPVLVLAAERDGVLPGLYSLRWTWRDPATGELRTDHVPFTIRVDPID